MKGTNLLPWRRQKRKREWITCYSLLSFCILCSVLFLYTINSSVFRLVTQHIRGHKLIQKEIMNLNKKIHSIRFLKQGKQVLISKLYFIQNAGSDRTLFLHVLNEISHMIPKGIYMNRLERKNRLVTLWGHSVDSRSISVLVQHIKASVWLEHPSLVEIKKIDKETNRGQQGFQLNMRIGSKVYS